MGMLWNIHIFCEFHERDLMVIALRKIGCCSFDGDISFGEVLDYIGEWRLHESS
jgi:hypothetical protein